MSRHLSTETFNLDLRSSPPSQQNLNPSRSSSLPSQQGDEMNGQGMGYDRRPHKLDLYSIPVFLLEVIVLSGLAYFAYYLHYQYDFEPTVSGFYCDDINYRQKFVETNFTQQFSQDHHEIAVVGLLISVPIVLIVFCELVNSMFGALKFRQIRALCACCKLHSITRRAIRFSGAFLLGFLIVAISCDVLASTTGRLRPYFAQYCPSAYSQCPVTALAVGDASTNLQQGHGTSTQSFSPLPVATTSPSLSSLGSSIDTLSSISPSSPPISAQAANNPRPQINTLPSSAALVIQQPRPAMDDTSTKQAIVERHWIDLTGLNLSELCHFPTSDVGEAASFESYQIAMSWPSFPAAVFTYACLYTAVYLCFVGTARPFRIITCVIVMVLVLVATMFNVRLVKEHYNHWDDVLTSSVIAFVVATFVLLVYLNKFKDTHYYEDQKLPKSKLYAHDNFRGYSNDGAVGPYNLDKNTDTQGVGGPQNGDTGNSLSNNELAMRYFQIPRANYRGAPRPLSSLNQMRQ